MKKLAYIILVIAILLLIGHFVQNEQTTAQEPAVTNETVNNETSPDTPAVAQTEAAAQTSAPAEDSDVVEVHETSEDIIIEDEAPEDDGAIDVEETSAATMGEEETVLPE